MRTLNDIVKSLVEITWQEVLIDHGNYYSPQPVITELILYPKMPQLYPVTSNSVFDGLGELFSEVNSHTESTKRRVKTELHGNVQHLELAWDGTPLNDESIESINYAYQEGKRLSELPYKSGTRRAGYFLGLVDGKIIIENFLDGVYITRNRIELPYKKGMKIPDVNIYTRRPIIQL